MRYTVRGQGGGKGGKGGSGSRSPVEVANSLRSKDTVSVLGVVSEGKINGFVDADPLKNIYLDDTPIRNPDGTENFKGYRVDYRLGNPFETSIPGYSFIEKEVASGGEIRQDTSITKTITDSSVDRAKVTITTDALQITDDKTGDIKATSVSFAFDLSSSGGAFVQIHSDTFSGKTSGPYRRQYVFNLPSGLAPWSIRVRRLTTDSVSALVQNRIYYTSLASIEDNLEPFNDTSLIALSFPSDVFTSEPSVSLKLRGIEVKVPHNYNPSSRIYGGLFNGTLQTAYTNNPVWILYDLITNQRYGLGAPPETIDIYSFYSASQYCDELVGNGLGGSEPRFTLNPYIRNKGGYFAIISSILASFRGNTFTRGGKLTLVVDKPKQSLYTFSQANVLVEYNEEGNLTKPPFTYQNSPSSERFNSILVGWENPEKGYESDVEVIEDEADILANGYNPTEITLIGCTSRSEAVRAGRELLFDSLAGDRTVSYETGREAYNLTPGDVVTLLDSNITNQRVGGRLKSVSPITLDKEMSFLTGITYTFRAVNLSGELETQTFTVPSNITTDILAYVSVGSTRTISPFYALALPFFDEVSILEEGSYWSITSPLEAGQDYKVVSIDEIDNNSFAIQGVIYKPEKYSFIETFTLNQKKLSVSNALANPLAPLNLQVSESLYENRVSNTVEAKISLIWSNPLENKSIARYEISYKKDDDNWKEDFRRDTSFDILNASPGVYTFRVRAVNSYERKSDSNQVTATIYALTKPPLDPENFSLVQNSRDTVTLNWSSSRDLDVLNKGSVLIKHHSEVGVSLWSKGVELISLPGNATSYECPYQAGTYALKFLDSTGQYCETAVFANTSLTQARATNAVAEQVENPSFSGAKQTLVVSGSGTLQLEKASFFDYYNGNIDSITTTWDEFDNLEGAVVPSGIYTFSNPITLPTSQACRVSMVVNATVFSEEGLLDSFEGFWDGMGDVDSLGLQDQGASIRPQIKVDTSEWQDFYEGIFVGQTFYFRLLFYSTAPFTNVAISSAKAVVDMADRDLVGQSTSLTVGNRTITFASPFYVAPQAFVSILNAQNGDVLTIVSTSTTSVVLNIRNAGTNVIRDFSYYIKGY